MEANNNNLPDENGQNNGPHPDKAGRDWRIPAALWERIEPLLPPRKPPPL